MTYYDITFHELSGKSVVKRNVPSDKEGFDAWQDVCKNFGSRTEYFLINDGTYVTLNRKFIVRIDTQEVSY